MDRASAGCPTNGERGASRVESVGESTEQNGDQMVPASLRSPPSVQPWKSRPLSAAYPPASGIRPRRGRGRKPFRHEQKGSPETSSTPWTGDPIKTMIFTTVKSLDNQTSLRIQNLLENSHRTGREQRAFAGDLPDLPDPSTQTLLHSRTIAQRTLNAPTAIRSIATQDPRPPGATYR